MDFLRLAASEVVVPTVVEKEIRARGPNDPTAHAIEVTEWLKVVEAPPPPSVIVCLGSG